jgi:hypothetical protein
LACRGPGPGSSGRRAGEAGVTGPVSCGGAAPVVGGVVVVAEEFGEDRGGDCDGERDERAGSGCLWADPEFAKSAADALGSDVRARFRAREQPRASRVFPLAAQQRGDLFGDRDGVVTEPKPDLVAVDLDIFAAEPDDAGDELSVEQQQRSGDADRGLGVAVVKQAASLVEAGGVIDRRVGRARRRSRNVQRRDEPGRVRPGQERAGWERAARRPVQPLVDVCLPGLPEREIVVMKPAGEADRGAQVGRSSRGCCLGGPVRSSASGRSRPRSSIVRMPRRMPGRDDRRAPEAHVVPSVHSGRGAPRAARERDGRRARSAGRQSPARHRADRGCRGRSRSPRGASRERSGRPGFARAMRLPTAASDGARAGRAAARAPRQHRDLRERAARPARRRARSEGSVVLSSRASGAGIRGSA